MLALLLFVAACSREIPHGPGEIAPDEPAQEDVDDDSPFSHGDYELTPLASYSLVARVLARREYHRDAGASLAPLDLAIGWGPMSDSAVLDKLTFTQNNRFFFWRTREFPIPRRDIETHATNMHLIPADDEVAAVLADIEPGHVVSLQGLLVAAKRRDGFRWRSSLSRSDTGNGACELMYVQSVSYE